jgi:hypothetical protein
LYGCGGLAHAAGLFRLLEIRSSHGVLSVI